MTDKLARIQEPGQPEETSVCHVEEDARQEASSEAGERSTTDRMQGQHLVEDATRRDKTCNSQTEAKQDLEQLEEWWAKLEDRLTAHVEAEIESRAAQ